ncbi:MFS transporter [Rhodococcus opacus]|uniref:Putative proline/betaine transporter n=1 Tax=Rhodococcus opacus TaxID=37919 RepID=A0A2S8J8J8_RHOOP|nr:MFS transporter [Rhodococcus opacus]PQP23390.1 MFS transporter [Rhodococcus opacus]
MGKNSIEHDHIPASCRERKAKRATTAAVAGTFVEYYDFSVYGYVAATLATVFFPGQDPAVGLLSTILIFGSAFVVRPLGAIFFGRIGDRKGRRVSLIACITCMGAAAGLTGLLPGYAQIGIWAPILLLILRLLQGFSTGAEFGGAITYIREWAPPRRRAFYISFASAAGNVGKALAAGTTALVASLMPSEAMLNWGWRIPFLLAVPLGILVLVLRLRVEDSPEFIANNRARDHAHRPVRDLFATHRAALAKSILIAVVQNIGTYIGTVFVAVYLSSVLGFSKATSSTIVLVAVLLAAGLIVAAGQLGTRLGGKRLLLWSYSAYIVLILPSFLLMNQGSIGLAILGLALSMVPYALCQAGTHTTVPELFPVDVRHTAVAFAYSIGAIIGGGGGPYLATWLIDATGSPLIPAFMLVIAGALGMIVVSLTVRPTSPNEAHIHTNPHPARPADTASTEAGSR